MYLKVVLVFAKLHVKSKVESVIQFWSDSRKLTFATIVDGGKSFCCKDKTKLTSTSILCQLIKLHICKTFLLKTSTK